MQPPQLASAPEVLNDYLYVDRERIAALHTQMLGSGVPLQSKFTESVTAAENNQQQAGIPKLFSFGASSSDTGTHGSERSFDLAWPMVLTTLAELEARGYIKEQAQGVPVGSIISMRGAIQLVDLRVMRDLWTPMMKMQKQQGVQKKIQALSPLQIADIAKLIPHPLVVQLVTSETPEPEPWSFGPNSNVAWGVLSTENVIGSADTFSLMNGGYVPGMYNMIAVLDVGSTPDAVMADPFESFIPSNTFEMMLGMQQMIRSMFGRPNYSNGVTPLVIYRALNK